ncbi:hypothetical protein A4G23_01188 [Streptomyces rubrolavendulae]|uniref:Uncharacterized protein n=1 Tax=Streptomyces rubrolavendulae TaxID=285473 RepID=A0A1D8FYU5_9ACTN|nr:hypothetical protein A4G23_01188 [Streptomyces rubrolavendulae]
MRSHGPPAPRPPLIRSSPPLTAPPDRAGFGGPEAPGGNVSGSWHVVPWEHEEER